MLGYSAKLKTSRFLKHIWILDIKSGVCLFEQNYSTIPIDADLVSGFLTAMRNFGHEIAHGEIQEISFNNIRFSLALGKFVLLVCTAEEIASKQGIKSLMDVILFEFEHQFAKELAHWLGVCEPFLRFGQFLENLLNKKPLPFNQRSMCPSPHDSEGSMTPSASALSESTSTPSALSESISESTSTPSASTRSASSQPSSSQAIVTGKQIGRAHV